MNRVVLILLCLFTSVSACMAKGNEDDKEDFLHHNVSMTGGLTVDTWNLELSYRFSPFRYFGIGAGVGYWKQYESGGLPRQAMVWKVSDDYQEIADFYLRPNVMLYTPDFFHIRDCGFSLYVNPGAILNAPYGHALLDVMGPYGEVEDADDVNNSHGRWAAFDLRLGLRLGANESHIFLGYETSNMDVYGMYRPIVYRGVKFNDFYPKRKRMKGVTLDLSLDF